MSLLRDFLVAPRTGDGVAPRTGDGVASRTGDGVASRTGDGAVWTGEPASGDRRSRRSPRTRFAPASGASPALGVLAPARELPVAATGVGLAAGGSAPTVLVCLTAPVFAPSLHAPPRGAAARLAASLRARGLEASARGRLALVHLPDEECADAAARALAAASGLPTVLAVAGRDEEVDALLAARDAILVALPPSAEPALMRLALAAAAALVPSAAALTLTLDPVQRALALAGVRAPRPMSAIVRQVVA